VDEQPWALAVGKGIGGEKDTFPAGGGGGVKTYVDTAPSSPLSWSQKESYETHLKGCSEHYDGGRLTKGSCVQTEKDRIAMNLRQPKSMTNYTELGFTKVKLDKDLFAEILDFWETNKVKGLVDEAWPKGNTYTNHWVKPTQMVSLENRKLRGGMDLKNKIWSGTRELLEHWSGSELTATSLYGIRRYQEGHVLSPHVDRMPLVVSCIINVAQNVEEPWPLEVYAHNGLSYNVTMQPGEIVLYESHSIIHGRPFPMVGENAYMANIFVHFEPQGHTIRHKDKVRVRKEELEKAANGERSVRELDDEYKKRIKEKNGGGHEHFQNDDANDDVMAKLEEEEEEGGDDDLDQYRPSYILKNSPEDSRWRRNYLRNNKVKSKDNYDGVATGTQALREAAQRGDLKLLQREAKRWKGGEAAVKEALNKGDVNEWTPLHEAARGGHVDVAKWLVENGSEKDLMTASGDTAAALAKKQHGGDHPIVAFFKSIGALEIGPDL